MTIERDIISLVRTFVKLTDAGGGNLKGKCPFHDDKVSSLQVRPSKGVWHCFGCGEGGDWEAFAKKVADSNGLPPESDDLPVVCLDGIPEMGGDAWRGHAFVPGSSAWMRPAIAVGTTLSFRLTGDPRCADEQFRTKYQTYDHDYVDTELTVNGETYAAVEVIDLGVRVRAASVKGAVIVAVVPEWCDVPGVKAVWPS